MISSVHGRAESKVRFPHSDSRFARLLVTFTHAVGRASTTGGRSSHIVVGGRPLSPSSPDDASALESSVGPGPLVAASALLGPSSPSLPGLVDSTSLASAVVVAPVSTAGSGARAQ